MVNMDRMKAILSEWIKVDTWHTGHPLDDKRFHKALSKVFSELGVRMNGGDFEEVLHELVDEYHPNWNQGHKEKLINDFHCGQSMSLAIFMIRNE
ncbi:MAG TPA: hypothetical protein VFX02_09790 [Gammaproteobacteria bacterium]|nr:hypothetical protein [Gammaproteobacteria bacterium]